MGLYLFIVIAGVVLFSIVAIHFDRWVSGQGATNTHLRNISNNTNQQDNKQSKSDRTIDDFQ